MTETPKYQHELEAESRRVAFKEALADQQEEAQQLEQAEDASREVAQALGTGGVDPDQLVRVRAQLEIAQARLSRTEHQVRLSKSRLLNESVDIAERVVPVVRSLVVGIKRVDVLAHEPREVPAGRLPVAAVSQVRESIKHPSGYRFTHSTNYGGAVRSVENHLWTTTGLHSTPTADQVARACRVVAQVSTGPGSDPILVSTKVTGEITHTTYALKVISCWPEVPEVDLSSPWFNAQQGLDIPVGQALAAPGLPSSVAHSSVTSEIIASTVDKHGLRLSRVQLDIAGASTAFAVATTTDAMQRLARAQVGRAHPWVRRCSSVEITRTVAVDAQGQVLEAGRTVGTPAGARVSAVLEFTSQVPFK